MEKQVTRLIDSFATLPQFEYDTYAPIIRKLLEIDQSNWSKQCNKLVFSENPGGDFSVVNQFKVQSIALAIRNSSDYGFNGCVKNTLDSKLKTSSSQLVMPIYRQFLSDHVNGYTESGNNKQLIKDPLNLLQLIAREDFCQAFTAYVLQPDFITDALIARELEGQWTYTEAIAYTYERCRATLLGSAPSEQMKVEQYGSLGSVDLRYAEIAKYHLPDIKSFTDVVTASKKMPSAQATQTFYKHLLPIQWSNNQYLQGPNFDSLGEVWCNNWSNDSFANSFVQGLVNAETDTTPYQTTSPNSWNVTTDITYGAALASWIRDKEKNGYGDIFNSGGLENQTSKNSMAGSCFSPNTHITTDHGHVEIRHVKSGQRVLVNAPSDFGTVSSELVKHSTHKRVAHNRVRRMTLFGFNDEKPFFTAGHVFFTTAGPRAIAPEIAMEENPGVLVHQMQEGDKLLRLKDDHSGYHHVEIHRFTHHVAHCEAVYGIHLHRSGKSVGRYHANRYLVAENYPELTIQSLRSRYDSLSTADKASFSKQIRDLPTAFRKVLGSTVSGVLADSMSNPLSPPMGRSPKVSSPVLAKVEESTNCPIIVPNLAGQFHLMHSKAAKKHQPRLNTTHPQFTQHVAAINGKSKLPVIALSHGAILVDGELPKHASMSSLSVRWSKEQTNEPGIYQHGVLRAMGTSRVMTGFVAKGPANVSSIEHFTEVHAVTAAVMGNIVKPQCSPQTFQTDSSATAATPSSTGGNWNSFWELNIGVELKPGGIPGATISMPDLDKAFNANFGTPGSTTLTVPYTVGTPAWDQATFTISIPVYTSVTWAAGFNDLADTAANWATNGGSGTLGPVFNTALVVLDLRSNVVHGYYNEMLNPNKVPTNGPIHAIYCPSNLTSLFALRKQVLHKIDASPLKAMPALNADIRQPSINIHLPALQATEILSKKLFTGEDLSVTDLLLGQYPSDTDLQSQSQLNMQHCAEYWRKKTEIDTFGDEKQAVESSLPESLKGGLTTEEQDFMGDYSRALIMQNLSTDSKYTSRFSDSDRKQLSFYWSGVEKGCIGLSDSFNNVTHIASREAFLKNTPALQPYIDDVTTDWAQKFFNTVTSPTELNNQLIAIATAKDRYSLTNQFACVLDALDNQNRGFPAQLWKTVTDQTVLAFGTGNIPLNTAEEFTDFAQGFTEQLLIEIQTNTGNDALLSELEIDATALSKAFQTKSAKDLANIMFGRNSALTIAFTNTMRDFNNLVCVSGVGIARQILTTMKGYLAKVPGAQKLMNSWSSLQSFAVIGMQGYALYSSIKALVGWKNLSDPERAQAIVAVVHATVNICKQVKDLIPVIRKGISGGIDYLKAFASWIQRIGGSSGPNALTPDGVNSTEVTIDAGGDISETTPLLRSAELANVDSSAGPSLSAQTADQTLDVAELGDAVKPFGFAEKVVGVVAVAANVATAVVIGFDIYDDFKDHKSIETKVLDILNEVTTVMQVGIAVGELVLGLIGVECAAVPFLGIAVAVASIVLLLVSLFTGNNEPEDPVKKYLDDEQSKFLQSIPTPPNPLMEYAVTPGQVSQGAQTTLTFTVTQPANVTSAMTSINLRINVSDSAEALFFAPTITTKGDPPTGNLLSYAIAGGRTDFNIIGATVASANNDVMIRVAANDRTNGAMIGSQGLSFTVTGTVNNTAGTTRVRIQESATSRPDGQPAQNCFTYVKVTKN